jgi:cytochrome c-type biogenesis protein CcmF
LINKGDRLFAADESQIMSRASTVSTQQTQQSLNALFAERDTAISGLVARFVSHPWSVNFLLIVSPLVTWIWLGALIIAFGGLIALWPVPAFARRRAAAPAAAGRRTSPALPARETV